MGIFQQFPYSNFHEMNLDQLIKIMREMQDEWAETKTEWASYKDFIDNYFANLDLDEETEKALQHLISIGALDSVIDPVIADTITEWMNDHITQPTTPAIDTSLSVAGAGADAKVTGDYIKQLMAQLFNSNCVDILDYCNKSDQSLNGITMTWHPDGSATFNGTATTDTYLPLYFDTAHLPPGVIPGRTYRFFNGGIPMNASPQFWFYKNGAYYTGFRLQVQGSVYEYAIPSDAEGMLIRYKIDQGVTLNNVNVHTQMLTTLTNEELANIDCFKGVLSNNVNIDGNLDDGFYLLTGNPSAPTPYGTLFVMNAGVTTVQIIYQFAELNIWYRRRVSSTWYDWENSNDKYTAGGSGGTGIYPRSRKMVVFGDSLFTGALWNGTALDPIITQAPVGSRIPDRIRNAVNCDIYINAAIGGQAITHAIGTLPKMLTTVQATNITDAGLIIIGGGRNDGANYLGTYNDNDTNTIFGALREIVNYIRTQTKSAQIVLVQVTPYTTTNAPWTSTSTAGWTLNDYDTVAKQFAEDMNIGYASWYGCSLFSCWSDLSGGGGNYAHMKDASSYIQMGDFIAGQVSKFYQN